jgi:hypothetical protein
VGYDNAAAAVVRDLQSMNGHFAQTRTLLRERQLGFDMRPLTPKTTTHIDIAGGFCQRRKIELARSRKIPSVQPLI